MPNFKDITGQRFGRLVAIETAGKANKVITLWRCICDCGNESIVRNHQLTSGKTSSCGCIRREQLAARNRKNTKHGETIDGKTTKEYLAWRNIHVRCDPQRAKPKDIVNYVQRGIYVDDRWSSFEAFLTDMGRAPSSRHSVDRIDNDGPYAPWNCRWATQTEQLRNTRQNINIEHNGITMTAAEWSRKLGGDSQLVCQRLRKGWSEKRAVTEPVHVHKRRHR